MGDVEWRSNLEVSDGEDPLQHEEHGPFDGAHGQAVQRLDNEEGLHTEWIQLAGEDLRCW